MKYSEAFHMVDEDKDIRYPSSSFSESRLEPFETTFPFLSF